MSKVLMNKDGEYLQFYRGSSHAPGDVYAFSFGDLNSASIVNSERELKRLRWKGDAPKIVAVLPCKVTRVVELVEDDGQY